MYCMIYKVISLITVLRKLISIRTVILHVLLDVANREYFYKKGILWAMKYFSR